VTRSAWTPTIAATPSASRPSATSSTAPGCATGPSGSFLANAAWLVLAALAHNLVRWVAVIGLGTTDLVVAKTLRRHLLSLPGRLTRSARRRLLHLPAGWPWAPAFTRALARLRALPQPT
jgi:hypothetical protein